MVDDVIPEKIATEKVSLQHVFLWDSSLKLAKLRNKITSPHELNIYTNIFDFEESICFIKTKD